MFGLCDLTNNFDILWLYYHINIFYCLINVCFHFILSCTYLQFFQREYSNLLKWNNVCLIFEIYFLNLHNIPKGMCEYIVLNLGHLFYLNFYSKINKEKSIVNQLLHPCFMLSEEYNANSKWKSIILSSLFKKK